MVMSLSDSSFSAFRDSGSIDTYSFNNYYYSRIIIRLEMDTTLTNKSLNTKITILIGDVVFFSITNQVGVQIFNDDIAVNSPH
jgi:hypothetical protein